MTIKVHMHRLIVQIQAYSKQFSNLHVPRTSDWKGSAWQISAHSCTACVRSISTKKESHQEEVKTHPEIDKACSSHEQYIRVVQKLPAAPATTYQYSLEQSVLFGW